MAVRKLVFLSDVHVGTNTAVNWYQKSVHAPYLMAALDYICNEAAAIDELVVLGDLFDFWTYPPDSYPPSFNAVVQANVPLFTGATAGQEGYFQRVLLALGGYVTFMRGNHDMTVTKKDLDTIKSRKGTVMGLVEEPIYRPKAGLGKVACTHGHIFSVFCAPDPQGLLGTLPIGYFVTRLAAQWDQQQLKEKYPPGSTVANMPNTGTPVGWSFSAENVKRILDGVVKGNDDLAELLFDVIIGSDAKQKAQTFTLPDGTTSQSAYDLARTTYKDSYESWVTRASRHPDIYGDPKSDDPGPFALGEVDMEDSLLHFAKILGEESKVVIMGHTHAPKDLHDYPWFIKELGESLYVNCGFNCPSIPDTCQDYDTKCKHPTFVELEIDEAQKTFTAKVRYVASSNGSYQVMPKPLDQKTIGF